MQLCTKLVAHPLINWSRGSIWLPKLRKKRPSIGLISLVTDYSVNDLLAQKIIDTVHSNQPRQLCQDLGWYTQLSGNR